ncbi:hypothetical protein ZWY2020_047533 [Hordeum vulgare]|nr:hypothetical protein ZWY2020_047533 [Hordeum vulgare]
MPRHDHLPKLRPKSRAAAATGAAGPVSSRPATAARARLADGGLRQGARGSSPWSEARAKEREGGVRLLNHFIMGEMEYWWWAAAAAGTVSPRRRHQEQELPTTRTRARRAAAAAGTESFPLASKGAGLTSANGKLCVLCEQYSTEALVYLRQKETQTEILSVLHHTCASLGPLRQQCMTLVDYYIPAFFLEISVLKPEELCESAHLCPKGAAARSSTRGEACGLCHHVLVELLTMLKDPNTKLEIVGLLFKTCSKAKNYEPQDHLGRRRARRRGRAGSDYSTTLLWARWNIGGGGRRRGAP